jgi:hypothetical protein
MVRLDLSAMIGPYWLGLTVIARPAGRDAAGFARELGAAGSVGAGVLRAGWLVAAPDVLTG